MIFIFKSIYRRSQMLYQLLINQTYKNQYSYQRSTGFRRHLCLNPSDVSFPESLKIISATTGNLFLLKIICKDSIMSLKAYEDACTRAELFGQPLPEKEDFLSKHKHLDVVEFEEVEIRTAENTAMLEDHLKDGTGGLAELNTILDTTQTKINRLKGVCGTITNFFRVKMSAKDNLSYSSEPSYIGQTNYDKDYIPPNADLGSINQGLGPQDNEMTPRAGKSKQNGVDINTALDDLKKMEDQENTSLLGKAAVKDIGQQVTTQISKLDQLINQADRAQTSLNNQNKQMRTFLR